MTMTLIDLRKETMAAGLHVHHHDNVVDVIVSRDNVYMGVELDQEELEILLHAIRLHISSLSVECGAGCVELMEGDEKEDEDVVLIGISHGGSEHVFWAARERSTLVLLLAKGCGGLPSTGAEPMKPKCSDAN